MADIVLIYPNNHHCSRTGMLFHPLGVAQLNAILRRDGLDSAVMDLTFQDNGEVLSIIDRLSPKIVGIYSMLTLTGNTFRLAREIRERFPGAILVCGGPMPTVRPGQFCGPFDLVFRGEAARSFPRFCRDFLSSGRLGDILAGYERYPGLYARDPDIGAIVQTPMEHLDEAALRELPLPDRRSFDHGRYQASWLGRVGSSSAGIMTSYGCPFDCSFCSKPVFGDSYRKRDMDSVMAEVADIKSFGYDGLWVADDCFTLDMRHVRSFCRAMIREKHAMQWTCLSRTGGFSLDDVELMGQAGCRKVFFGLESGSDEVLRLMNKKATAAQAEHAIDLFTRCGIETAGFFMVGYPGETCETIEKTFAWALTLPLSEISFTLPFPLPGTRLYEQVSAPQEDADWTYESENRMVFSSEFDEAYLNRRIRETCEQFAARGNHASR